MGDSADQERDRLNRELLQVDERLSISKDLIKKEEEELARLTKETSELRAKLNEIID